MSAPSDLRAPNQRRFEPPSLEDAKRQYVELFGSALVMNTYLKIALVCVSIVAAGLTVLNLATLKQYQQNKPLVIRIDEVGRAQAVHYDALTYKPTGQAPELKYFLIQFITTHFGRMRSTVKAAHAESLDSQLVEATIADNQKHQTIETFLTGTADEIEINVRNVSIEEIRSSMDRPHRRSQLVSVSRFSATRFNYSDPPASISPEPVSRESGCA